MENPLSAISLVTGGLTLIAFVVSAVLLAYTAFLKQRESIIKSAEPKDVAVIDATLDRFRVDTSGLTNAEKTDIVLRQIGIRARRELMLVALAALATIILGTVTIVSITTDGGPAVTDGGRVPQPDVVSCADREGLRSKTSHTSTTITFVNNFSADRRVIWFDYAGRPEQFATLHPSEEFAAATFVEHPWMTTDESGNCVEIFMPSPQPRTVNLR